MNIQWYRRSDTFFYVCNLIYGTWNSFSPLVTSKLWRNEINEYRSTSIKIYYISHLLFLFFFFFFNERNGWNPKFEIFIIILWKITKKRGSKIHTQRSQRIIISIKLISHHVSIIYSYFLPNTTLCRHHHSINHETGKKIWLPVIYEANYVKNRIPIENVIMAKTIIKRFWIKKILNNSTFIITINFISRHQSINFTHSIAPFVRKSIYFFFLFK